MALYRCPHCGNISISWDSRGSVFLCNVPSCSKWYNPPPIPSLSKEDVAALISHGKIVVTQEWFDCQTKQSLEFAEFHAVES